MVREGNKMVWVFIGCSCHIIYLFIIDRNSARFLWKSIPSSIKENRPEVVAVWKIGQHLWTRNYAGVYDSIRGFNWSAEIQIFVASFAG